MKKPALFSGAEKSTVGESPEEEAPPVLGGSQKVSPPALSTLFHFTDVCAMAMIVLFLVCFSRTYIATLPLDLGWT